MKTGENTVIFPESFFVFVWGIRKNVEKLPEREQKRRLK